MEEKLYLHVEAALKYAQDVCLGTIPACKWVKLACQRQLDDLKRQTDDSFPYRFDYDKGNKVCNFLEKLPHIKGIWTGSNIKLEPWEQFIWSTVFGWVRKTDGFRRFHEVYAEIPRKNSKALDLNTPIPTPDGWSTMDELSIGDKVFDEQGNICTITNVSEIFKDHDCYKINFSNEESVIADAGHLWLTTAKVNMPLDKKGRNIRRFRMPFLAKRKCNNNEYWYAKLYGKPKYIGSVKDISEEKAREIFNNLAKDDLEEHPFGFNFMTQIRTTENLFNTQKYGKRNDTNHSIAMPEAINLSEQILPIDPYVLGMWLGDGTSASPKMTSGFEDVEHFMSEINNAGYNTLTFNYKYRASTIVIINRDSEGNNIRGQVEGNLIHTFKDLNIINNKHIPGIYLRASKEQRLALLQGLMDTDGTISKDGKNISIVTIKKQLACNIGELLSSLGIKYSIIERSMTCNGKQIEGIAYNIQYHVFREYLKVFRLPRKLNRMRSVENNIMKARSRTVQIVSVEKVPSIPTKCITVDSPNGMFLFGRTMLPTHNSTQAAGIGLYMFTADGENGPEIYSGATGEKQAWEVFGPAKLMATKAKDFKEHYGITINASNMSIMGSAAKFEPVIGNPGDGSSPHCSIIDEYHEHKTPDLYDTMITGMGARKQPLQLVITTAGSNTASPCYDKHLQICKILEKVEGFESEEVFGIIFTLDKDQDWTNFDNWKIANPNYGVSVFEEFLHERYKEAMQRASRQNIIRCKHLNQWMNAGSAYINMVEWNKCLDPTMCEEQFLGQPCWVGIDLSSKVDIAAMLMLFKKQIDGKTHYYAFGKYYLPEEATQGADKTHYDTWVKEGYITTTPGNRIDLDQIELDLLDIARKYQVQEVPHDPWGAPQFVTHMMEKKIPMVEMNQTVNMLSDPLKELDAIIRDGKFHHVDDPVLEWMASNLVAREDKKDNVFPYKERAENKIDGIIALIMAIGRAMTGIAQFKSRYEKEGEKVVAI